MFLFLRFAEVLSVAPCLLLRPSAGLSGYCSLMLLSLVSLFFTLFDQISEFLPILGAPFGHSFWVFYSFVLPFGAIL